MKAAAARRPKAPPATWEPFKPYLPRNECALVMGVSQSGKTTRMVNWLDVMGRHQVARVVWDRKDQHSIYGKRRGNGTLGNLKQRLTVPQLHAVYRQDRRVITRRDLGLCIVPSSPLLSDEDLADEFRSILPYIYGRGQCVFIVEEVGQLVKKAEAELNTIASVWPEDVSTIFVGQVPTMFTTWQRANAMRCISGVQPKASDRNTIGHDFGEDYAAHLEHLGLGEFLMAHNRPRWAIT
ncbi:MAG: hypothetical protein ACXU86_10800 [Archangium sp.]